MHSPQLFGSHWDWVIYNVTRELSAASLVLGLSTVLRTLVKHLRGNVIGSSANHCLLSGFLPYLHPP